MCADRVTPLRPDRHEISGDLGALAQLVNHEAEQALLGAILVNNKAYDAVCDIVAFDDFGHPLHGEIYAAIGSVIAGGAIANPVTLAAYFAAADTFLAAGGRSYLARLAESAVTVINAYYYGATIRDLARRRDLVDAAQKIVNDAALPQPDRGIDKVLDDSEQLLHDIAQNSITDKRPQLLSAVMPHTIEAIEAAYKRGGEAGWGAVVIDTGISAVDKIIRGMGPGDLVVLAGRPAMGKTAAAATIAANAAAIDKAVAFFSLEMTAEQLTMRWIAGRTGIATDKQRHGELDRLVDWPIIFEANQYISRLPIYIDDQPRLGVGQIRQRVHRIRRQRPLDLVCIDHLQLMRQAGRQENRRIEIGDITSSLKALAKEFEVPILLVSQLNRALENRDDKRPTMADLKESGDIEQDADIVIFVHREAYYLERFEPKQRPRQTKEAFAAEVADWEERREAARGRADLIIAKNRQGRTGFAVCAFDAERQRFETLIRGDFR